MGAFRISGRRADIYQSGSINKIGEGKIPLRFLLIKTKFAAIKTKTQKSVQSVQNKKVPKSLMWQTFADFLHTKKSHRAVYTPIENPAHARRYPHPCFALPTSATVKAAAGGLHPDRDIRIPLICCRFRSGGVSRTKQEISIISLFSQFVNMRGYFY